MPRIAKELGPLEVKRLTGAGLHPVGGVAGLMLQVSPTGTTSWLLRVKVGDKRREIGLGAYPAVGVALARQKARVLQLSQQRDKLSVLTHDVESGPPPALRQAHPFLGDSQFFCRRLIIGPL